MAAYDYWDGYTAAQIELMAIDQPITVYPKTKKDNGLNGGHSAAEMRRINEQWEKKYGKPGKVSEKIKLSDFLARNKKDNG